MEPELSTTMPMATGMSSCLNEVMVCGRPSSKTLKSPLIEVGDDVLLVVDHGGVQQTSSTCLRKTKTPLSVDPAL
jgi:hypothetical protein